MGERCRVGLREGAEKNNMSYFILNEANDELL